MSQAGSAAAAGVAGDEQDAGTAPIPAGDPPAASAGVNPDASASLDPANRGKQASTELRDPVEADSLEAAAKPGDVGIRHPIVPCGGLKSAAHSIPEADIPVISSIGSTFGAFTAGSVPQDGLFLPTLPQVRVDFPPGHLVRTTSQDSSVAATLGSPTGSIMSLDQFSTCSSIPPYHMSPAPSFTSDQPMADLAGSGLVTSRLGISSKALFSSPGEKPAGGQSVGVAEREAGGSRFGGAGASYPAPATVQTLVVVRHAEPIDEQDDGWAAGSDRPWDPPLSARGAKAAEEVGQALRARGFGAARSSARGGGVGKAGDEGKAAVDGQQAKGQQEGAREGESGAEGEGSGSGAVVRVVVSPFRRCVQTAVHIVAGLLGARTGEGAEGEKGTGEGEGGKAGSGGEGAVTGGTAEGLAQFPPWGVAVTHTFPPLPSPPFSPLPSPPFSPLPSPPLPSRPIPPSPPPFPSPVRPQVSFSPALAEVINTRALRGSTPNTGSLPLHPSPLSIPPFPPFPSTLPPFPLHPSPLSPPPFPPFPSTLPPFPLHPSPLSPPPFPPFPSTLSPFPLHPSPLSPPPFPPFPSTLPPFPLHPSPLSPSPFPPFSCPSRCHSAAPWLKRACVCTVSPAPCCLLPAPPSCHSPLPNAHFPLLLVRSQVSFSPALAEVVAAAVHALNVLQPRPAQHRFPPPPPFPPFPPPSPPPFPPFPPPLFPSALPLFPMSPQVSFSPALAEVMNTRALRRCTEERPPAASIPHSSMAEHAGLAAAVEAAAAEACSKGWVLEEGDLKALFPPGTTFLPFAAASAGSAAAAAAAASGEGRAGRSVHSEFPIFPESLESARERFMQAFDDVAALFPSDSILCVTHGDAVAASVERLAPVTVVAVDFCGYSWSQRRAAPLYTHPSRLHHDSHHLHHHASLPPLPPPPPPPPTPANEPESLDGEDAGLVGSRQTVSASFAAAVVAAGSETEAAAVAAAAVAAVAGLQASRRGGLGGVVEEGEEEGEGEEGGDGSDGRSGGKQGALSDSVVIVGGSTASDISTHESEEDDKDTVNSSIDVGPSLSEVAEGDEEGEERGAGEEGEEVGSESGQDGVGGRGRREAGRGVGMEVGEWELLTSSGSTGVCWISNIALAARDDETPTKGLAS
ncbi:unnamed protein product [Closterium sp. Naga37s-1]|nr:unnamed protein product [Closterium sp. Naga37s-1]